MIFFHQDQAAQESGLNLQEFSLGAEVCRTSSLERGHFSDTTASAGASDDEGSTAATDGSTLRTPPAEQGGSAGSESGGENCLLTRSSGLIVVATNLFMDF